MKTIYVSDKHRTNSLSLEPGGHEVTVVYRSGLSKVYDKVKHPKKFISKTIGNDTKKIAAIFIDGKAFETFNDSSNIY